MKKFVLKHLAVIITGVLAFAGGIGVVTIPELFKQYNYKQREVNLVVTLRDADTSERIAGHVFINNANIGTFIDSVETPPNIPLVQGYHYIRAASDGYGDVFSIIDHIGAPLDITMRKIVREGHGLAQEHGLTPLTMTGWYPWGGVALSFGAANNELIINRRGILSGAAGIVSEHVGTSLRGKTLVLCFSNVRASSFIGGRMARLEADDIVLLPDNASSFMDFLPVEDRTFPNGFEFKIPDTFNGKLNIVFYQAELNDLQIAAYYRQGEDK